MINKENPYTLKSLIDILFFVKLADTAKDIEDILYYIIDDCNIDEHIILYNTNTIHTYIDSKYIFKPKKMYKLINIIIKYYINKFNIRIEVFKNEFKSAIKERNKALKRNIESDHTISYYMKASSIKNNPSEEEGNIYSIICVIEEIIEELTPFNEFVYFLNSNIMKNTVHDSIEMNQHFSEYYILSILKNQDELIENILEDKEPNRTTTLSYQERVRAFKNSIHLLKYLTLKEKNEELLFAIELIERKFSLNKQQEKAIIEAINKDSFNYIYSDSNNNNYYPLVIDIIIAYSYTLDSLKKDLENIIYLSSDYKKYKELVKKSISIDNPLLDYKVEFYQMVKEKDMKKYIRKRYNQLIESNFKDSSKLINQLLYKDSNSYKNTTEIQEVPKDLTQLQLHTKKLF